MIIPGHLERTIGLGLPINELGVDAILLDQTLKMVPPEAAALVALEVEDLELADEVAEIDVAFTGYLTDPNAGTSHPLC